MSTSMMKAVRIHSYGGVETLRHEEAPRPAAGAGQVLVKVAATSVNPFDCAVRAGYMSGWYNYPLPHTLGLDVAGTVAEVGEEVSGFAIGDEVYGRVDPGQAGAYAEYVAVNAALLARKPSTLSFQQAAGIPHVMLTAWAGLYAGANVSTGQRVLIHGAAGGVGHMAVQLAKRRGAYVIGTCSARNVDFVRGLGADEVVDYTATPFDNVIHDMDVVLDTVGGETQDRSWSTLKPGGALLSTIQTPSADTAATHNVRSGLVFAAMPNAAALVQVAQWAEAGEYKVEVSSVLPLAEARRGHEMSETRRTRGKIVLAVS
ncbi:MAG: NADP-dependent oxidoreductase [Anaerolineae bacterium]